MHHSLRERQQQLRSRFHIGDGLRPALSVLPLERCRTAIPAVGAGWRAGQCTPGRRQHRKPHACGRACGSGRSAGAARQSGSEPVADQKARTVVSATPVEVRHGSTQLGVRLELGLRCGLRHCASALRARFNTHGCRARASVRCGTVESRSGRKPRSSGMRSRCACAARDVAAEVLCKLSHPAARKIGRTQDRTRCPVPLHPAPGPRQNR